MTARTLAVIALLLLNGFFVAAEFALVRARRTRLEAMTRRGDRLARIALRALADLPRALSVCQLGITLASLGLGWVTAMTLGPAVPALLARHASWLEVSVRGALGATVALVVVGFLHVVFAELVPRTVALNRPEIAARWLAPPLLAVGWVLTPVSALARRTSHAVLRAMGTRPEPLDEQGHSADELMSLVEQSEEGGLIEPQDAELLEAVFEFSGKTASEVMTPRIEIVAIDVESTLDETLATVMESGFSRYPVYRGTIDQVVGVLLAKDLLSVLRSRPASFALTPLMRPVHVIPGTREVEDVLADFKRLTEHLAIVLDEYGGTAGLVTMEDVLEEIVGEIRDEYDDPEPMPEPSRQAGEVSVPGTTHIVDLNERFALDLPAEEYHTVGGFLFGVLGRLPKPGDRVSAGGAVLTVREMDGRRIETIAVDLHSAGDRRSRERDVAPASSTDEPDVRRGA